MAYFTKDVAPDSGRDTECLADDVRSILACYVRMRVGTPRISDIGEALA